MSAVVKLGFEDRSYFSPFVRRKIETSPGSLETGFAKSTGNSCNSPRLGIWLLASTEEPYPMRTQKKIVLAAGAAGIGWAVARIAGL
jgi:hypothetical protein